MSVKKGYAGEIRNNGAQVVSAPFATNKRSKGSVKHGADLRTKEGIKNKSKKG